MREIAGLRAVAPVAIRTEVVVAGNQNHSAQIMGTDNAYLAARDWGIAQGRPFTEAEIRAGRTMCIMGQTVRTALFGSQNPIGTDIRVGDAPCEVVGVLEPKGQSTFGQDQDDVVLMPIRALQRRITGNTDVGHGLDRGEPRGGRSQDGRRRHPADARAPASDARRT